MVITAEKSSQIWYVEPQNSHTNTVFAGELPGENFLSGILCADGKRHNLWICPDYQAVQSFWDSREDKKLNFEIYGAFAPKGGSRYAKIRKCTFLFKPGFKAKKLEMAIKLQK